MLGAYIMLVCYQDLAGDERRGAGKPGPQIITWYTSVFRASVASCLLQPLLSPPPRHQGSKDSQLLLSVQTR